MFHLLSQIWSLLLTPSNALIAAMAAGLVLASLRRGPGFGSVLAMLAGAILCTVAILPVGNTMLQVLESRFPAPAQPPRQVAGVILLGGSISLRDVDGAARPQPNGSSDRIFVAAQLARRYPSARIVVVGGPEDPATGKAEADFAASYLQRLGVAEGRILKERRSADTFENARNAAALVHPNPKDQWMLVTSAFHMPRAVASFREAGFQITPAPADWRTVRGWRAMSWSATGNLQAFDTAVREAVGLAVYFQRGRTSELFPRP